MANQIIPVSSSSSGGYPKGYYSMSGSQGQAAVNYMYNQQQAIQNAMKAYDQSTQAGISGRTGLLNDVMSMMSNLGMQEREDISGRATNRFSDIRQDLVSSGLAGTTILPTARMGVARDQEAEYRRLNEMLLGQQIGAKTSLMQDLFGYIERRGPSYSDIMNLAGGI